MPTAKPTAFDTGLDPNNDLNDNAVFSSWAIADSSNPTRLTDVSGNDLHGTLTGLGPDYDVTVTGGTLAGSYTADGSANNKTKWAQDGGYAILAYSYMGSWGLYASQMDFEMDMASYSGSDALQPWLATWSGITVGQGDLGASPFFVDGLACNGSGYVDIAGTHVYGQSGMTLAMLLRWQGGEGWRGAAGADCGNSGTGLFYFQPRSDLNGYAQFRWYGTGSHWGDACSSASIYPSNQWHWVICTVDADHVRFYIDGTLQQEIDRTRDFTANNIAHTILGGSWGSAPNDQTACDIGSVHIRSDAWTSTEVATFTADPFALAAASSGDLSATAGLADATASGLAATASKGTTAGLADATASGLQATAANAPLSAAAELAEAVASGLPASAALAPLAATAGIADATAAGLDATGVVVGMPYRYYAAQDADLTAAEGATLEADLRVVSSDSGADKGGSVEICEGTNQYVLWLRADGFNLHGQAHVAVDLSDRKHRIKLKAANGVCRVYVDEQLRQYGEAVNATARREAAWGSWPGAA